MRYKRWIETADNPFFELVDMARLGLIVHSRGGEAVAAAFTDLAHYPDDASVAFDFGSRSAAFVAIAPVGGHYKRADRGTPVIYIDDFVIHASRHRDVQSFAGLRHFEHVEPSVESFGSDRTSMSTA